MEVTTNAKELDTLVTNIKDYVDLEKHDYIDDLLRRFRSKYIGKQQFLLCLMVATGPNAFLGAISIDILFDMAKECSDASIWENGGIKMLVQILLTRDEDLELMDTAVRALTNLASTNGKIFYKHKNIIRNHGGIAPIVALLRNDANSKLTITACKAITSLGYDDEDTCALIREIGGIPLLVALLPVAPSCDDLDSEAPTFAADALATLAFENKINCDSIREAGGIPLLVELLKLGHEYLAAINAGWALMYISEYNCDSIRGANGVIPFVRLFSDICDADHDTSCIAAGALMNLSTDYTNCDSIHAAGGIPLLVALLPLDNGCNAGWRASKTLCNMIICDLWNMAKHDKFGYSILESVIAIDFRFFEKMDDPLYMLLKKISISHLEAAEAGNDVSLLEKEIMHATALQVESKILRRANNRLEVINDNAALQKRREALGIDTLPVPNEFICPITFDKMVDPVVASDGNSYERSAIAIVLERPNPLSPLTREPLDQALFVNRNLKKRILEYENDVLNIVEHAVALATERLAHDVKRQKVA